MHILFSNNIFSIGYSVVGPDGVIHIVMTGSVNEQGLELGQHPSAPPQMARAEYSSPRNTVGGSNQQKEDNPYLCPLTHQVMKDPVICSDGYTYERAAIESWFAQGHNTSPLTRNRLENLNLVPNNALKAIIMKNSGAGVHTIF
jgi:hypothetical protein